MGGSAARVGAGGVVISDLSKACLRARAWCDVAPANAVCCLASEGEQSSDDGSFLWPGGKYGIRRREGSGDVHKEVVCADGRNTVQLQHSPTEDIETVAGPKSSGHAAKQWSCPKNCGFSTSHPPALTRHLQAGKCKPSQKVIDGDTSPDNQTGPPAGYSSSAAS
mmetsp:Transcript_41603/g.61183  ORF Transcript_41603/g.61183 Transcript_41603/m.61183 type:complete len:165 (-) Transcript_41603:634-1128(-)